MNVFSRKSLLLLTAACTVTTLIGCSPQAVPKLTQEQTPKATTEGVQHPTDIQNTPAEQNPNPKQVGQLRQPKQSIQAPQVAASRPNQQTLTAQANELAQVINGIVGVKRAAVLLTGKTALIGVDLDASISGSRIDSIKYTVKETAERHAGGYHAVVTSDIDTVQRARNLVAGMRAGKPVSTVSDEIADIISRLVPEM